MIRESKDFSENVNLFTTLVSKQSNLKGIFHELEKIGAKQVKEMPMGTGNKVSRARAWRF
jgi:23S rRNA (adenine1618-N6)-methyltransferase